MRSLSRVMAGSSPSAAAIPVFRYGTSKAGNFCVRWPVIREAFGRWRSRPTAAASPRAATTEPSTFGRRIECDCTGSGAPGSRLDQAMLQTMTALQTIPVIDLRDGGPPRHARQSAEKARALRDACLGFFPRLALPLVPALDSAARAWLARSRSPYISEIAEIAGLLDFSGVWLLNASYQWACTSLACEENGVPWLVRTLDWPFVGLGRHVEVARMGGDCGDFFSVTWPGYVGALTAMAPARFAACVNQAPMQRRTAHRWLRAYDFVANALTIWQADGLMPPDQLLRRTFESCADYGAARRMLERTPVARPVIYVLAGCAANVRCVIESTETG